MFSLVNCFTVAGSDFATEFVVSSIQRWQLCLGSRSSSIAAELAVIVTIVASVTAFGPESPGPVDPSSAADLNSMQPTPIANQYNYFWCSTAYLSCLDIAACWPPEFTLAWTVTKVWHSKAFGCFMSVLELSLLAFNPFIWSMLWPVQFQQQPAVASLHCSVTERKSSLASPACSSSFAGTALR